MASGTLEALDKRLTAVEEELVQLKQQTLSDKTQYAEPRWKGIIGIFKDDALFDEAERLGREWRASQREDYDNDADTPA